ncbi:MAG TPA: TonB-dependent receptor [Steroidobacteraceae bacterium]|nr:TonB-dependent receptor [Steroidobacteraceae bacterium]
MRIDTDKFAPRRARFSCLAALALAGNVWAAERAERVEEVIVTATRTPQQLREFPGSISVVSGGDVALVGATHHAEIMNRAPGTMIQRNSGEESLTAIRSPVLTGPGSCGVFLFLENSIPIRPTGFCNVNELFEVNSEQAQSIEVLRGPAGVVYGSGAMHGAVNVIQAPPADLPSQSLSLEGGPDEFYRGRLTLAHQGEATDVGGTVIATHDGGWRDHSGLEEQKLNLGLSHRLGEGTLGVQLAGTNLNQETAGFIQGFDSYRDENIAKSNANPEAYRDAYALRLTGEYARPLGAAQLTIRPFVRHSRMDFLQHFLIGKPLEENGQDSLGVLTALQTVVFDDMQLLAGVDLELADGFLEETQDGPATDGPPAANAIRPAGKHYDYDVQSQVAALYAQIEQPFAQRWKLTAGARLEYVDYEYDNKMLAGNTRDDGTSCGATGCLFNRPADRNDDFTNVTSKLGLSYSLTSDHTLYVTGARGYRAPDTSELYRLQRQQSIADLDAERLDSVEVGGRGVFGPLHYSLAVFKMKKDNVIFRDSNGFNVSDGKTDHEGVEYEFNWLPIDTLSVALAGTYAKHTYAFNRAVDGGETIISGRDVDTAPRHVNTARLGWQFLPVANAELEWVSVGRYFVDAANANEYPGHDLLNLRVGWNIRDNWTTTLRLSNVTDRAYADRADFAFGNYRYFPGRGRALFVEVRYRSQ